MELAPRSLVVVSLREVDLGRFGFVLKTVLRKQSRLNKSFTNVRIKIAYDKSLGIEGYDLFGHELPGFGPLGVPYFQRIHVVNPTGFFWGTILVI